MAENDESLEPASPAEPEPPEPAPSADPAPEPAAAGKDWKGESRKWESRAKDNQRRADAAEAEKASAESKAAASEGEVMRLKAAIAVAEEKGVPASLLQGETPEEMEASADELIRFADSRRPAFPADQGGSPGGAAAPIDPNTIKDPVKRLRARTEQAQERMRE